MANKTFVLTITTLGEGMPINFNIVTPNGMYKSGSRMNSRDQVALEKCINELKASIREWNSHYPDDEFPNSDENLSLRPIEKV